MCDSDAARAALDTLVALAGVVVVSVTQSGGLQPAPTEGDLLQAAGQPLYVCFWLVTVIVQLHEQHLLQLLRFNALNAKPSGW